MEIDAPGNVSLARSVSRTRHKLEVFICQLDTHYLEGGGRRRHWMLVDRNVPLKSEERLTTRFKP